MMPIYVSIIIIVIIVRHKLQEVTSKPEILKTKTDYTSIIVCSTFCYFFIPLSYKWFIPPLSHRRYLLTLTFFIHCGNVLCFTGRVSFMIIYSGNLDHFPDLPSTTTTPLPDDSKSSVYFTCLLYTSDAADE